jgi:hypothetical protein
MIEKCEETSRAAGKPATGPMAAETTGTVAIASTNEAKRGGALIDSMTTGARLRLPVPATLPPPPSRKRTSGSR